MNKDIEKDTHKYRVDIHVIGGIFGMGSIMHTDVLSEVELHNHIMTGTQIYEADTGRKPDLLAVKVRTDSEVVESKLYSLVWIDQDSFELVTENVQKEGNLFDITADIEERIKKEAAVWKAKELKERIDQALDEGNKEEFLNLSTQLNELEGELVYES